MNTVIITVQAKNVKTYSETFYNNTGNLSHFLLAIVNILGKICFAAHAGSEAFFIPYAVKVCMC